MRKPIGILCDPQCAAKVWIDQLVSSTPSENLRDVLCRLVVALLTVRGYHLKAACKPIRLECAADRLDRKSPSIRLCYHVIDVPTIADLFGCKKDLLEHSHPLVLVPRSGLASLMQLAKRSKLRRRITIFGLEGFFTQAILFLAIEKRRTPFEIWKAVIDEYNHCPNAEVIPSIRLKPIRRQDLFKRRRRDDPVAHANVVGGGR